VFAAPAMLLFRVFYCLATAIAQPKAVMAIQLAGLALKVPLNYMLMYGKFGLPELGGVGCAWALVIESWLMIVAAYAWVRLAPQFRALRVFAGPWRIDWASQRAMVALGAPIGGAILIDVTSYTFMALFIARLGEDTSAAHQIAANVGALAYMVPLALSNAAGVVVGHALGAGQLAQARALGITGLRIGLAAALLVACVIAFNTAWIAAAYAKDSAVRTVAALLLPFVAAFHIGDACNAMASNIARAYKKTVVPMLVFALALWVVGLGGGYLLAYGPSPFALLGARGFWAGAVTGMSLAAIGVTVYTLMVMRHDVLDRLATTQDATPPGPPAVPPKSPATN
jgi:multidrug resistance protein, MATE family